MDDKIVIYEAADGEATIEVKLEGETVWLSSNQMALLFEIRKIISNAIQNS